MYFSHFLILTLVQIQFRFFFKIYNPLASVTVVSGHFINYELEDNSSAVTSTSENVNKVQI